MSPPIKAINVAKQGFGITRVLSYQVANELATGELNSLSFITTKQEDIVRMSMPVQK